MNAPPNESEKKAMEVAVKFMQAHDTSSWVVMKKALTDLLLATWEGAQLDMVRRGPYEASGRQICLVIKSTPFNSEALFEETLPSEKKE